MGAVDQFGALPKYALPFYALPFFALPLALVADPIDDGRYSGTTSQNLYTATFVPAIKAIKDLVNE